MNRSDLYLKSLPNLVSIVIGFNKTFWQIKHGQGQYSANSRVGITELDIPGESLACGEGVCSDSLKTVRNSGTIAPGVSGVTITPCPTGYQTIAGGFSFNDPNISSPSFSIAQSEAGTASGGVSTWLIQFKNTGSQRTNLATSVVCLKAEQKKMQLV